MSCENHALNKPVILKEAMSSTLILKVLIADDHFLARQLVIEVLSSHNVSRVDTASDGQEARAMIADANSKEVPYDIVFLDWNMPVMLGIEVLRYFRAQPAYGTTAFVMLTAESTQSQVLEALKAGATGYIVKPVSKETISRKFYDILDWLNKKRAGKIQSA